MPELNWKHHTLIQSLLSRGPLTSNQFHQIFEGFTGRNPGAHEQLFNDYLLKVNEELAFAQIELRACRNQYGGKIYYGVVNNVADEHSKLGTKYSVPQIAFYKGIIEAIVHDAAGQGCINSIDALHIKLDNQVPGGSQPQPLSQTQTQDVPAALCYFTLSRKEETLGELIRDGWLTNVDDNIGLGVRSFLDLRSWFHNNEIPACEVCNDAGVKFEKICPGCNRPWPYVVAKAEMVDNDDDSDEPTVTQPTDAPSQRRRRGSQSST